MARLLPYITGLVNQELLLQNEYLAAENGILKAHLQPGLRLSDGERATLAEIGKRLGRKGLQQVARIAKPDTILGWYRKLVAAKFDGSKQRRPTAHQFKDRGSDCSVGARKLRLGLRSNCGSVGQPGAPGVRSDRGQRSAPPRDRASAGEEQNDHLEGVHSPAYGCASWHGLLHGRGADLARPGNLLCSVFHSPGQPAGVHRWNH